MSTLQAPQSGISDYERNSFEEFRYMVENMDKIKKITKRLYGDDYNKYDSWDELELEYEKNDRCLSVAPWGDYHHAKRHISKTSNSELLELIKSAALELIPKLEKKTI